ncbi:MAG: PEP-CTERM sorting domain-containing protein [Planctomycetes bacterium]|nr:PEP-CTERM sorting domain-containing protein [Planctomycetota bacterium]
MKTITISTFLTMMLLCTSASYASVVAFTGEVTSIESFGTVDAISQYIAVGDTFSGTFEYDPSTPPGTAISTIDDVGEWFQYEPAITNFSLTFSSGNSTGFSIDGFIPSLSRMSVADDILNSSTGPLVDITSGVVWHTSGEFRPGLTKRNLVYRFWDFDESAMSDSASLADWDADQAFANLDTQSNELAFNSSVTNFAQRANFVFTSFSAIPEPSTLLLSTLAIAGLLFPRHRKK